MAALPVEIWQIIMLADPAVYCVLVITCRAFRVDTAAAKAVFTRIDTTSGLTYTLPCGWKHRIDGPARICSDGTQIWYIDGMLHRGGDLPAISRPSGSLEWWMNGTYHRDNNLPAVIGADGSQYWFWHGSRHRTDGPAIVYNSGSQEWWIDNIQISRNKFERLQNQTAG